MCHLVQVQKYYSDKHQSKQLSSIFAYRFQHLGWISQQAGSNLPHQLESYLLIEDLLARKMKLAFDGELLHHLFCYASAQISRLLE